MVFPGRINELGQSVHQDPCIALVSVDTLPLQNPIQSNPMEWVVKKKREANGKVVYDLSGWLERGRA
jgi:hypothetical protein